MRYQTKRNRNKGRYEKERNLEQMGLILANLMHDENPEAFDEDILVEPAEAQQIAQNVLGQATNGQRLILFFNRKFDDFRRNMNRHNCRFRFSLRSLFVVLFSFLLAYNSSFPFHAPPAEKTMLEFVAGHLATIGTVGSGLSYFKLMDPAIAAYFAQCSLATQAASTAVRYVDAYVEKYPMTQLNVVKEGAKFVEYWPNPAGYAAYYGKMPAAAAAAIKTKGPENESALNKTVRVGKNAYGLISLPAGNAAVEIGKRFGYNGPSESFISNAFATPNN